MSIYEGAGNRTTNPNFFNARLAELLIPHPSSNEQRGTAATLDALTTGGFGLPISISWHYNCFTIGIIIALRFVAKANGNNGQ